MTIRRSQGKPRLEAPRVAEMGARPASAKQARDRNEQLRENARLHPSKRALRAGLHATVGEAMSKTGVGSPAPVESRQVAAAALQLAHDAQREVGVTSVYVLHFTTRFGVNSALAGYLTQKAAEAGFDSARGLELLASARDHEAAATRAMVAAAAAVKAFAGGRRKGSAPLSDAVEREYQRFLEAEDASSQLGKGAESAPTGEP